MPPRISISLLLGVLGLLLPPVISLASIDSYNRHFDQCMLSNSQQDSRVALTFGQRVPYGMTLSSVIDKIERFEMKAFKDSKTNAATTALALLHWFALPDVGWSYGPLFFGPYQKPDHERRYRLISRLFQESLSAIADHSFEEILNKESQMSDEDMDEICYLMFALSHTVNITKPRGDTVILAPEPIQPLSAQEARRRPAGSQSRARMFNADTYQANPQLRRPANPQRTNNLRLNSENTITMRESGVVSITGKREDSIALAPVLLGIASRLVEQTPTLFSNSDGFFHKDYSRRNMDALPMSTVGQEVGYAAFRRRQAETSNQNDRQTVEIMANGGWNDTGCLTSYLLNYQAQREIALTRAQLTGAVDGYIIGSFLKQNQDLANWSLSKLLRFYYSNNQVPFMDGSKFSVCDRPAAYARLDRADILEQGKLMAYGLAIQEGKTFRSEDLKFSGEHLLYENSDIQNSVQNVLTELDNLEDSMKDLRDGLCRVNSENEECGTPAHVFVVLDTGLTDQGMINLQSRIVGRILNGMSFETGRSEVSVYASRRSGQGLMRILTNKTAKSVSGSGCAACIAQFIDRLPDGGGSSLGADSEADIFNSMNETFRQLKLDFQQNPQSGAPSRVVIYFRLNDNPISAKEQAAEALNRFRLGHSEVRMIAIGAETRLEELRKLAEAFIVINYTELESELNRDVTQAIQFKRISKFICESSGNLQNEACNPSDTRYSDNQRNSRGKNGDITKFEAGVNVKQVQFWAYNPNYFSASNNLKIKFTAGDNGHIKVCDATSGYSYLSGEQTSNKDCQSTSDIMKTVVYNYTRPCKSGPRSCSPLRFSVSGLTQDSSSRGRSPVKPSCKGKFCESQYSVQFTVEPVGMKCASSGLAASLLLVTATIFVQRLFIH